MRTDSDFKAVKFKLLFIDDVRGGADGAGELVGLLILFFTVIPTKTEINNVLLGINFN